MRIHRHRLSRRALLRSAALGGSGLLAAYVLGCDDGDDAPAAATATQPAAPSPTTAAPSPTPMALAWRRLAPTDPLPPPRRDHALVTDGRLLYLHGGRNPDALADLWSYDLAGGAWSEITVSPAPAARFGQNAVWDPMRDRLVLFGGQQASNTFFNDTWAYNPAEDKWTELPANESVPAPRYGAASAFDAGGGGRLLVTHGFTNSGRFDDTWSYGMGGGPWSDISPQGTRPIKRCLTRAVWDAGKGRLLMFGGQTDGTPFLGDLWALGAGGWAEITAEPKPSPRNFYAMVFDDEAQRLILVGGNTADGPLNDLWFLDAAGDTWSQASPQGEAPSSRAGHDAVWLPDERRLLLFGGSDAAGEQNDLWELTVPL